MSAVRDAFINVCRESLSIKKRVCGIEIVFIWFDLLSSELQFTITWERDGAKENHICNLEKHNHLPDAFLNITHY